MIKTIYENIADGRDLRANLIELKMALRQPGNKEALDEITDGDYDVIMRCLSDQDAKVRKNAAAVLREVACPQAFEVLLDAYEAEDKLFVRADYIKALAQLPCRGYLDYFRERLLSLQARKNTPEEEKHIREEIEALQYLLQKNGGAPLHSFCGHKLENDVLLMTQPAFVPVVESAVKERHRAAGSYVQVHTQDLPSLLKIRPVKEILFLTSCRKGLPNDPQAIAQGLLDYGLDLYLGERLQGKAPYYFRLDIPAKTGSDRSDFMKKTASAIEKAFGGDLVNSVSGYECEIRLLYRKDGTYLPLVRFSGLEDHRFDYRRETTATDIKPFAAAGLMELACPYLKEHAQILDPFCGTGTLLIERNYLLPARTVYGVDKYGEAIEKARINTAVTGMRFNYINRDFMDFTHNYPFDEIITDMPGNFGSRQKADDFYRDFLDKSISLLAQDGLIICRSQEMGIMKKQLRLHKELHLLQEFVLSEKKGHYLFVIGRTKSEEVSGE